MQRYSLYSSTILRDSTKPQGHDQHLILQFDTTVWDKSSSHPVEASRNGGEVGHVSQAVLLG